MNELCSNLDMQLRQKLLDKRPKKEIIISFYNL